MKKLIKYVSIFLAFIVIAVAVDAAAFSNYYGKQTVRLYNDFNFYSTTAVLKFQIDNSGNVTGNGQMRDTSAFTTTSVSKAIYIAGALPTDNYIIAKRLAISSTSTAPAVDSLTYQYIAKTDSLIVVRPNSNLVSGAKFGWYRFK